MKKKSKLSTLLNEQHQVTIKVAEVLGRTHDSTTILDTDGIRRFVREGVEKGDKIRYIIEHYVITYCVNF